MITVQYKGQEFSFEARLAIIGYTHKFYVFINGIEVIYEPDEERKYRALLNETNSLSIKEKERELMVEVGKKIEEISL